MKLYLRALGYFKQEWGKIVLSLAMIVAMTQCSLLLVYPWGILADSVFGNLGPTGTVSKLFFKIAPTGKVGQAILLAGLMLATKVLLELITMFQTLLSIRIGYGGVMRVRCDLFRKLQELSLAYHKSQPQGDMIYRLSWDTYGVQTVLGGIVQSGIVNALTLVWMTWIMFDNNWRLTIVSLAVAPLLLATTKLYAKVLQKQSTAAKEVESKLTTTIQRSAATIGLVQAFSREQDEYQRFDTSLKSTISAYLRMHRHEVLFWLLVGTILAMGSAAIFGYGGYLIYQDQYVLGLKEAGFTIGKLSIFLGLLDRMYGPLKNLSGTGGMLAAGVAGCKRVFEVLDRDPIIKDSPNATHLPRAARKIEMTDVVFGYREGIPVLTGMNCTIKPGEMVAFVGESGVGKTTLLNLLPRFYDPQGGTIKLDGHDLRDIRVADVRKHVALVLQENVVLPTTIAENIAYGMPKATEAQIKNAAELAGAADFIEKLPAKYDEEVSESGNNLSGGQKQRISIARALLTEAPIIIMDEPTSALDPLHEQMIIETLKRIKGQRTLILVSHRLSTVADCDQIFLMEAGKIIEQGTHAALVAKRGAYFQMARHQMRLEEVKS